ncbi:MAG: hypothetical protein HOP12_05465, partial [Candidatus Eisenbacteria bacterium]|nr:hypothetical protein [Candidatus Eisenbacteria bacterium]
WLWARRASDARGQLARWSWMRRPAAALWLAAGCHAAMAGIVVGEAAPAARAIALLSAVEAIAVLWAGLELVAALPLERPYSEHPGPLRALGPWLPLLLPAAGFAVLWRHADSWMAAAPVRDAALALLALTCVLAMLRAFSRRRWVATLRWLAVADTALAVFLVGLHAVTPSVALVLWLASYGACAALLAGELRGAAPRRREHLQKLWRLAGWSASAALAAPVLLACLFGGRATPIGWVLVPVVSLRAWIAVRRLIEAPERRTVTRHEPLLPLTGIAALLSIALAVGGLLLAWWEGFQAPFPQPLLVLLPPLAGGLAAWQLRGKNESTARAMVESSGPRARALAHGVFVFVTRLERWAVSVIGAIARTLMAPLRDLHTGDAQEYLLLLVGLSIFSLLVAMLQ